MKIICGKTYIEWLDLFMICYNIENGSFNQWCWPDGKSYLEQPQIQVSMFELFKSEATKQIQKKMKQKEGAKSGR